MTANFNYLTDEHMAYAEDDTASEEQMREAALVAYPIFDQWVSAAEAAEIGVHDYIDGLTDVDLDRLMCTFEVIKYGRDAGVYKVPNRMLLFAVHMYCEIASRHQKKEMRTPIIDGYVYILKSENGDWKIGRTIDPANRQKTFSVKLPFRVNYEMVIPSAEYKVLEAELHKRFAYCRLDGEWFDLTDGDIADLKREFENVAEQFNE